MNDFAVLIIVEKTAVLVKNWIAAEETIRKSRNAKAVRLRRTKTVQD